MFASRARRVPLALCALACLVPTAAVAATTAPATTAGVSAKLDHGTVRFGDAVTVTGRVATGSARQQVALQFQARGASTWKTLKTAHTKKHVYRIHHVLPGRGSVRVVLGDGSGLAVKSDTTGAASSAPGASSASASAVHGVKVRVGIGLHTVRTSIAPGGKAVVTGHVLPRRSGRLVTIQRNAGHGWATVVRTRSAQSGAFRLAWRPGSGARIRVVAGGDTVAAGSSRSAGRLSVVRLRDALASRYDDYGGPLACMNSTLKYSQLGVANKSLPCGTKVTIRYHGRTVVAPVIDRGPYVGNREFDLTGATARALHFDGVGTIQVAY
jgi:hypothetical protein